MIGYGPPKLWIVSNLFYLKSTDISVHLIKENTFRATSVLVSDQTIRCHDPAKLTQERNHHTELG